MVAIDAGAGRSEGTEYDVEIPGVVDGSLIVDSSEGRVVSIRVSIGIGPGGGARSDMLELLLSDDQAAAIGRHLIATVESDVKSVATGRVARVFSCCIGFRRGTRVQRIA